MEPFVISKSSQMSTVIAIENTSQNLRGPSAEDGFYCGPEFIPENMGPVLFEIAFHLMELYFWTAIVLLWVSGIVLIVSRLWRFAANLYWLCVIVHNDGWHAYLVAEQMRLSLEEEEEDEERDTEKTAKKED